jgi:hypothetical protein
MLFHEDRTQFETHLPTCPFFQFSNRTERKWGMTYNRVAYILDTAIRISFSVKSGAGGFSISPMFTYYATIDEFNAPAFQVVRIMSQFLSSNQFKSFKKLSVRRLLDGGLIKIGKMFREGKASPSDVNSQNQTLMKPIVTVISHPNFYLM